MPKSKSVLAKARAWALKRRLFGPQAFLRYAIFGFAENLNQVSDDFVFKGGNLLWVYIATPRATIDLDLATLKTASHGHVNNLVKQACSIRSEIHYSLIAFSEIEQDGKPGAAVTIQYETDQGAKNRFEVDIVYALSTENQEIESPIHPEITIRAAFLLHEAVYRIARESSGQTDSFLARRLTAALFAQNASIADIQKLLQQTYFQKMFFRYVDHESFAVLKGRDNGYIRARIIAVPQQYSTYYLVECYNLAGERTGIKHELSGTGAKTFTIPAADCPRMLLQAGYASGEPDLGITFELSSGSQVFYVRSTSKRDQWQDAINIGRYFSIGARIP